MHKKVVQNIVVLTGIGVALSVTMSQLFSPKTLNREAVTQKTTVAPLPPLKLDARELLGEYYFGDGMGQNCHLKILEGQRFFYRLTGCGGEYNRNQGSWELVGDTLVLHPEKTKHVTSSLDALNLRLVPVHWGKRLYLVDENELPGFCASWRETETQIDDLHGRDYVKVDWNTEKLPSRQGKPQVPARYQEFLTQGEITATVVALPSTETVLLKQSAAQRLKVGMRLCLNNFGSPPELRVRAVQGRDVIAERVSLFPKTEEPIVLGNTFTTGSYWHRPEGTWQTLR